MNVLLACDGLDAVVASFDDAFVEWLLDRHHDLLRCTVTPQVATYVPQDVVVQGVVFSETSLLQSALEEAALLVVDVLPETVVPLENIFLSLDLLSGSWSFEASYQGKSLEIERCSFTSLELLKAMLLANH